VVRERKWSDVSATLHNQISLIFSLLWLWSVDVRGWPTAPPPPTPPTADNWDSMNRTTAAPTANFNKPAESYQNGWTKVQANDV